MVKNQIYICLNNMKVQYAVFFSVDKLKSSNVYCN